MTKRLILWDIDGTLLHTRGAGRRSTHDAMVEVFGTASTLETHVFGGKTDWFTLAELLRDHGLTAEDIGHAMPRYEEAVARHLRRCIDPTQSEACPGALEAVAALRADADNTLLGIVTGNCASTAPIKLEAAGFDPTWFPVGAFGSEAIERDDLPALALQRAIAYSGWKLTPADVTVIGDTVADIACARALGARVIVVATGHSTREALIAAQPDHLLDDLTTVLDYL